MYNSTNSLLLTFLMIYLAIIGVVLAAALASYILKGIGMYTIGKHKGLSNPWLAFIPYARTYFQGEICGTLEFKKRRLEHPGIWLIVVPFAANIGIGIFMMIMWGSLAMSAVGLHDMYNYSYSGPYMIQSLFSGFGNGFLIVAMIGLFVLCVAAEVVQKTLLVLVNQQIYGRHTESNYAIMHAVIGVFVPLYTSIYFFVIRNRAEN